MQRLQPGQLRWIDREELRMLLNHFVSSTALCHFPHRQHGAQGSLPSLPEAESGLLASGSCPTRAPHAARPWLLRRS